MESPAGNNASSWFEVEKVGSNYVFPEKDRPGELPPVCHTLPVIDLGNATDADLVDQIFKASQEFGFFQVLNIIKNSHQNLEFHHNSCLRTYIGINFR